MMQTTKVNLHGEHVRGRQSKWPMCSSSLHYISLLDDTHNVVIKWNKFGNGDELRLDKLWMHNQAWMVGIINCKNKKKKKKMLPCVPDVDDHLFWVDGQTGD